MKGKNKKEGIHDSFTKRISLHPSVIGLEGIVLSTGEAFILDKNENIISAPDDLLFDPYNLRVYSIEYKCHKRNDHKAQQQLHKRYPYLETLFPEYEVISLYIHDNYEVERIK